MKNVCILFCIIGVVVNLVPAKIINNKGNRTQSYPLITEVNRDIMGIMNQVSISRLESDVRFMQNVGIRKAESEEALITQNWLIERFESIGLDVYVHSFTFDGDTLKAGNVIATKYGTEFPDEYIVISSHYDHQSGPGADDNASGTAAVIEIARILSKYEFKRSIMFITFNAEEYWMKGSLPFAEKCAMEDKDIVGVFNLDMLGFFPEDAGPIKMYTGYSHISKRLFDYHTQVANMYFPEIPTLLFSDGDSYGGDHMPFNINEYPALYIGDVEYLLEHPCYHKLCDTIGSGVNNFELFQAFTKTTIASTIELANGWFPPQDFSACPSENSIQLTWDISTETSRYEIYRNNVLLAETESNSYIDIDVIQGERYNYFVKAVHDSTGKKSNASNSDYAIASLPLKIPYSNTFSEDKHGFIFNYDVWEIIDFRESKVLSNKNTSENGNNCFTVAEMQWFSIPSDVEEVSLSFRYFAYITNIYKNVHFFAEVTKDRKVWQKLIMLDDQRSWTLCESSLNEYIDSPYCQIRFRLEGSGSWSGNYQNQEVFIDDVFINYKHVDVITPEECSTVAELRVYPNPSSGIVYVETNIENKYNISVYDVRGSRIFSDNDFEDGKLDLSNIDKGIYFISIDKNGEQISRRIIIN